MLNVETRTKEINFKFNRADELIKELRSFVSDKPRTFADVNELGRIVLDLRQIFSEMATQILRGIRDKP